MIGQKQAQIANAMGLSRQAVSYTVNNPMAQELIHNVLEGADVTIKHRLEVLGPQAVDVIEDVMLNEDEPSKLRTHLACHVLSCIGYGPVSKVEGTVAHGLFTSADIEELKTRLSASRTLEVPAQVVGE